MILGVQGGVHLTWSAEAANQMSSLPPKSPLNPQPIDQGLMFKST